jgi:Holliday junction resolvase RusA-like endonuclease
MADNLDDPVLGSLTLRIRGIPMPPSVNSLYFTKGGKRILTTEGRVYKDSIKQLMADIGSKQSEHDIVMDNIKLSITYDFYFKGVETKSWHTGKSKNRFRKVDISNRVKVLEDGLVEGLGIDDTQFMRVNITKNNTNDDEYVDINIYRAWEDVNVQGTRH